MVTVDNCLVQVELFWGTEIIDDSLSLVDVAYIYVMKKVRIRELLNSNSIEFIVQKSSLHFSVKTTSIALHKNENIRVWVTLQAYIVLVHMQLILNVLFL